MSAPKPIGHEVAIEITSSGQRQVITRRWRIATPSRARAMGLRVAGAQRVISVIPLYAADFAS